MEEVEELFTSPQFLRRMGAGGAKPLLTKVISPLRVAKCQFFYTDISAISVTLCNSDCDDKKSPPCAAPTTKYTWSTTPGENT